jgi:hypothetical protein
LLKLLTRNDLNREQRDAVCDALIEKCGIYGNGAARRGNRKEAEWMASIAQLSDLLWRALADGTIENAINTMRGRLRTQELFPNCFALGGG